MTPQEARNAAVIAVRSNLGLDQKPPSDWTYDERVNYNKALSAYIAANAAAFSAQDVATATAVQNTVYSPLADDSLLSNVGQFGEEFVNNVVEAGDKVADVGRGALDAVSLAGKLLPFAVVAVALYFVIKYDPRKA